MKKNSVLLISLVFFLVVTAYFVGYYSNKMFSGVSQNSTVGNPDSSVSNVGPVYSYKNFSIQIPSNWHVFNMKEMGGDWGDNIYFASPTFDQIPEGRAFSALRIRYLENVTPLSFEDYKVQFIKSYNIDSASVIFSDFSRGTLRVYESNNTDPFGMSSVSTYFYGPNKEFAEISMEKQLYDLETYRSIVKTVKFQ